MPRPWPRGRPGGDRLRLTTGAVADWSRRGPEPAKALEDLRTRRKAFGRRGLSHHQLQGAGEDPCLQCYFQVDFAGPGAKSSQAVGARRAVLAPPTENLVKPAQARSYSPRARVSGLEHISSTTTTCQDARTIRGSRCYCASARHGFRGNTLAIKDQSSTFRTSAAMALNGAVTRQDLLAYKIASSAACADSAIAFSESASAACASAAWARARASSARASASPV